MFIGQRRSVTAGPTGRDVGSREASEAMTFTPVADSAGARLGLSVGICGSDARPECSPVTTSLAVIGMPLLLAQVTFLVIAVVMSAWLTHWVWPPLVAHCHGVTVKSCTQPRYGWSYVWLMNRNWPLFATTLL